MIIYLSNGRSGELTVREVVNRI